MIKQNKPIFLATSNPTILERDRFNKESELTITNLKNLFMIRLFKTISKFLQVKANGKKEIILSYIGGYEKQQNINVANSYKQALTFYLKELFGLELKINLQVLDEEKYLENPLETLETLSNSDCLILGVGVDSKIGKFYNLLNKDKISLKKIIEDNNIFTLGICAGSVLTADNILGSDYDNLYMSAEKTEFPKNYSTIQMNPVTMETNLYPSFATDEENERFKTDFLYPLSIEKTFFGCRPNSFILIGEDSVTATGEIYLFLDGQDYLICEENKTVNLKELNDLISNYNTLKESSIGKVEEISGMKEKILNQIVKTKNSNYEIKNTESEDKVLEEFKKKEINRKCQKIESEYSLKKELEDDINNLFNNIEITKVAEFQKLMYRNNKMNPNFVQSLKIKNPKDWQELYLKFYFISIFKKYGYAFGFQNKKYLAEFLLIVQKLSQTNPLIALYFADCFALFYSKNQVKEVLKEILEKEELKKLEIKKDPYQKSMFGGIKNVA